MSPANTAREDGVIALATFELLAQERGLGTLWSGFLKYSAELNTQIKRIIGVPDELVLVGALCVGYPSIAFQRPATRRPNTDIQFVE